MTDLAPVLKHARKSRGMSQRDVAKAIGCNSAHVSLTERGKRTPSLGYLADFAGAVGVPMWALIRYAEDYSTRYREGSATYGDYVEAGSFAEAEAKATARRPDETIDGVYIMRVPLEQVGDPDAFFQALVEGEET